MAHREDYDTAYRDFRWPRDRRVQLGARPLRRRRRRPGAGRRSGRCGSSRATGREAHWTFAELADALQPGGQLAARPGRGPRRPDHPDARQPGRAVGDAARRDEARRGRHPGHHAAAPPPTCATGSTAGAAKHVVVGGGRRRQVRRRRGRLHADRRARRAGRAGSTTPTPTRRPPSSRPTASPAARDTLLLYFTSGTTAKPKLVEHTHASYPVGHLSTMYWIGLQPGDVHLNISSPGWAKHAWSNVFAPWIAESCVLVMNYAKFDAAGVLGVLDRCGVDQLLRAADGVADAHPGRPVGPGRTRRTQGRRGGGAAQPRGDRAGREGLGACGSATASGRPRPPCRSATRRGSRSSPARWAGRSPGYPIVLVDPATGEAADEGEICLDLAQRPLGLMVGYHGDPERNAEAMAGGYYHTGDVGSRDADGYITYVGRADDVFKASTTGSARSSWRACSSSTRRSPRRPSCRRPTRCGSPCRRPTSCWPPGTSRPRRRRGRSSSSPATTSPRTSGSAGWSSPSCPRRSPARSAGSSCAAGRASCTPTAATPAGEFTL